ncbi:MAG: sugar kinase [Desulfobacterales bacterium]|nr:sugar kinase [Desulfobacterales bacterium]
MENKKKFDVTTLGSTMLRLSVPPGERLETAPCFQVHTAGSESNTMVALSRMGKQCAWVSKLCDNALGQRIVHDIRGYNVDVAGVVWENKGRNESFFVEYGAKPRKINVIYDRENAAVSTIAPGQIDRAFILNTRIFHGTGIFPALSQTCCTTLTEIMKAARQAGVVTSFDVNFRKGLWSEERAARTLDPFMGLSDLIFITREDALDLFGHKGSPQDVVTAVFNRFSPKICIVTLGNEGGIAYDGDTMWETRAYDVEAVDRLGAGDSFTAGFLCGFLENNVAKGMAYASAMAALKLGIKGDYFTSGRREVEALLTRDPGREVGR